MTTSDISYACPKTTRQRSFPVLLLLLISLSLTTHALNTTTPPTNNCDIPPLILPIYNVTLPDGVAINRGVYVEVGGQTLGLRLTLLHNNTRLRNQHDCS